MSNIAGEDIAAACIETIAAAKSLDPANITPATTLASLELDSLDRVTLAFDLEERYHVTIPEATLHAITTVADVIAAVQHALQQQSPAAPEHPAAEPE